MTFQTAFHAAMDKAPAMDKAAFQTATSPETFVARRDRIGGPAPAALEAALKSYVLVLYGLRTESVSRKQRITDAQANRAAAFAQLLEI